MRVLKVYKGEKLIDVLRDPQISDAVILAARKRYGRGVRFVSEDIEAGSIYEHDAKAYDNREELGLGEL